MFRFIQVYRPQKFLQDVFIRTVQNFAKTPIPVKISVAPNSPAISIKPDNFANEIVVITGGAQGLGRSLAEKLAKMNATVAIWDDNNEALRETVTAVKVVGGQIHSYFCDMSSREEIYKVAERTKKDVGQVTMVINSAEVASEKLLLDTPDYYIQKVFDINTMANIWTTKAFLPNMIDANRGHIVIISSMASHMAIQKLSDYCASKAAATGFLQSLRTELEREGTSGVKTTVICPYFMQEKHSAVKLRLLRALDPDTVADKTIAAIKRKEELVFIPGWFKYALLPKWITPATISSILLRLFIKDLNPSMENQGPTKIVQFVKLVGPIEPSEPKLKEGESILDDLEKMKNIQKEKAKQKHL